MSSDYDSSPKAHNETRKQQEGYSVFVRGITPKMTRRDLEHFFAQYGKILGVSFVVDHITQRSRPFVFVNFDDEDTCARVADMGEVYFGDHPLTIERAKRNAPYEEDAAREYNRRKNYQNRQYDDRRDDRRDRRDSYSDRSRDDYDRRDSKSDRYRDRDDYVRRRDDHRERHRDDSERRSDRERERERSPPQHRRERSYERGRRRADSYADSSSHSPSPRRHRRR